jgi:predicted metal-dependent phosphoesterase TrpH
MLRVEFHCHTKFSRDSLLSPETLLAACRRKGIQRVVVTDHNTIRGARRAYEIDPQMVVIGEEIMTLQGELLAAFVSDEIPPGLPAVETIERLRAQGAFISVSHPFDRHRKGHWQPGELEEIAPLVDAIETFNARCVLPRFNAEAAAFARRHGLPGTAGSDAHTACELGRASMLLPEFNDAQGLRQALEQVEFQVRLSSPLVHLSSRYAVWRKKLQRR